jgi:antitoxin PrlF
LLDVKRFTLYPVSMIIGKLSSKHQVTLPKAVRDAVGLHKGDSIAFEAHRDRVILRRVEPLDAAFHKALESTLEEWAGPEDEEAFRDL